MRLLYGVGVGERAVGRELTDGSYEPTMQSAQTKA